MTINDGPYHERTEAIIESPVAHTVVNQGEYVVATPVAAAQVRTATSSRFAPDAIIAAIAGLVLLLVGLIAITRGGFDGKMSDPVVEVLGFTHTTTGSLAQCRLPRSRNHWHSNRPWRGSLSRPASSSSSAR